MTEDKEVVSNEIENSVTNENQEGKGTGRSASFTGRLLHGIGVFLMAFVVAACLVVVIPKIAGYESYIVISGSMEPTFPVGSIVYSKETDPTLLRSGDVIVFSDPSRGTAPITHRVVSNNPFTQTIRTKGDANSREDVNPVSYEDVIGKVERYLPSVGFIAAMFSTKTGKFIVALMLLEAWLLMEIGSRLKGKRIKKRDSI